MQVSPSEPQSLSKEGFLQNSFKQMNGKLQNPILLLIVGVFFCMALVGYWIGSTMVVNSVGSDFIFANTIQESNQVTYLLLETDDLSLSKPQLNSIWFIHLFPEDKTRLGFTPVVSLGAPENDDSYLLKQFSLDDKRYPSRDFLQTVSKKGFPIQNYVLVDKTSAAAFINWFAGKELTESIAIEMHTMAQYGQVLRGLCSSLSLPSQRGATDFPWSKITPNHFSTSLQFDNVINNLVFLTTPISPRCEMVPLP